MGTRVSQPVAAEDVLSEARRVCVAPMVNWTHRHQRYFMRLVAPDALLYTEMTTAHSLLHGDPRRLLRHHSREAPLALQLGGADPAELATASRIGEQMGFAEINLNLGCPSPRVQRGSFGACLMTSRDRVTDCFKAMRDAVQVPVTVKHRTGVDQQDSEVFLLEFVGALAEAGCKVFIVHARKALLSGLNPRQNRRIPPLNYERVKKIKRVFPDLRIVLNGGITDVAQARQQLQEVDGVMFGRAAYHNPFLVAEACYQVLGANRPKVRGEVFAEYADYVRDQVAEGEPLGRLLNHTAGLFHGLRGAKRWRQLLMQHLHGGGDPLWIIEQAGQVARHVELDGGGGLYPGPCRVSDAVNVHH